MRCKLIARRSSSDERKAVESAQAIADALDVDLEVRAQMHENDRSSTGFLPPDAFEKMADAFFASPDRSVRGWERAVDAQLRIVGEIEHVLMRKIAGDVLFVGHGAVGTLAYCHYSGNPISRTFDQPAGGGSFFTFLKESRRVRHGWRRIEDAQKG
jgi:broad specificity phosphatase PhoE